MFVTSGNAHDAHSRGLPHLFAKSAKGWGSLATPENQKVGPSHPRLLKAAKGAAPSLIRQSALNSIIRRILFLSARISPLDRSEFRSSIRQPVRRADAGSNKVRPCGNKWLQMPPALLGKGVQIYVGVDQSRLFSATLPSSQLIPQSVRRPRSKDIPMYAKAVVYLIC